MKNKLDEVYKDSGLGKWFHDESANSEPGWDRYNSSGKRVGKCGDAKEGSPYSACLSKQKADKLGKEGIASFVQRKRKAQKKSGYDEKGEGGKGRKPVYVETGAAKKKNMSEATIIPDELMDINKKTKANTPGQNMDISKRNKKYKTPPCEMDKKIVEMKTPVGVVINSVGKLARQLNVGDIYYKNATTPVEVQEVAYQRDGSLKIIVESMGLDRGLETIEECSGDEIVGVFFESENKYFGKNSWGFLEEAAVHKGKKVKLNKPMRGDVKKYKVYVKNDKGNIVKVEFGDPNMEIKRDNPARRKNFRARHNCDNPGPVWKARYWACRFWSKESVSSLLSEEALAYGTILEKNAPKNKKAWSNCIAQAKKKFDVYPCVPMDSLAITKTGPQSYENLNIGDEILSYNAQNDELEWKPILNLHHFENAPIVEMGKATGFKIKCTPNHKWVIKHGQDYSKTSLIETKDINKHMQIITCATLNDYHQSVLENWSKKDSWVEKVLSMSKHEREIYLASAIVYDGHDQGVSTKISNRHTFGFSQKNEDHFYAAILAAFLNGYHVSFSDKGLDIQSACIIRNKKTHNTQNLIIKEIDSEDVWCPETENGTWVMIQNGFITITGNSAYANAWAAKCYKKKGGQWRKLSEYVENCGCDSTPEDTENVNEYQFKINNGKKVEETPVGMLDQMINTKKVKDMEPQKTRINYLKGIFEEFKK